MDRFSNKRGVEMSLNMIVIAVIALIVLVIIVIILTGSAGRFSSGTTECKSVDGSAGSLITKGEDQTCGDVCQPSGLMNNPIGSSKTKCCCISKTISSTN
jgi:hypothetical protein